ncbi:MAG: D-alanyl-D-alanine carboxypeptidase/D-alanyl-D-alanine-endopeptidase [Planctomycetes bacterium]|nr:D-alanyl-D-alanine carboxypeptidase/D-alanyl-D-alanine-endopeptidase [Planctomycetota bacterium]
MTFSRSAFSVLFTFSLLLTAGVDARSDGNSLPADAASAIRLQLDKAEGKRGTAGCVVLDLDSGDTLYSHNADKPLSPASNMKLVTTAAALKLLGGDFEFRTLLLGEGRNGGPLYVLGGGDPNLSGRFHDGDVLAVFRGWAEQLKKAGITEIDGLRYDSTVFGGESYCEGWPKDDQYIQWYCAEVSALAFNDNCVGVRVVPGKAGQPANIELTPPTAAVKVINETTTLPGRKGAEIGIVRPRGENTITVKGKVYEQATWGYTIDVTVHDPALYAATVLRETLQAQGITVIGTIEPVTLGIEDVKRCTVLVEHKSTLLSALPPINTNSQNLHAELLFRQLGLRYSGKGTFKTSRAAVEAFLREQGWWADGVNIVDGSGLARDNRVTAHMLTKLLQAMAAGANFEAFRDSLAVAGETGTLEKRLNDKSIKGRVYAKTGYIRGVRALSGYILTDNRRVAFSMLMNDCVYTKETQDEIVTILARALK